MPTKRGGLEQLDANSSLKLLVSKCPRECNGFEESSSNVSRSPATFLIKPQTKLQGVLVHSSKAFPWGEGKSWSQRQCKGLDSVLRLENGNKRKKQQLEEKQYKPPFVTK